MPPGCPSCGERGRAVSSRVGRRVGWRARKTAPVACSLALIGFLGVLVPAVASAPPVGATAVGLHGGGSVEEAWLTGAGPGDRIDLVRDGRSVAVAGNPGRADALGSLIILSLIHI